MLVDEIVVAGQLAQAVLAAELVEARNAVLAVADEIEGGDVDLLGRAFEPRHRDVLQELRDVVQREQSEPLAAQCQAPVARPRERMASVALPSKVSITGNLLRRSCSDLLTSRYSIRSGTQRMQTIDGDEFFGEVEGRTEVVDAAVDVSGLVMS